MGYKKVPRLGWSPVLSVADQTKVLSSCGFAFSSLMRVIIATLWVGGVICEIMKTFPAFPSGTSLGVGGFRDDLMLFPKDKER